MNHITIPNIQYHHRPIVLNYPPNWYPGGAGYTQPLYNPAVSHQMYQHQAYNAQTMAWKYNAQTMAPGMNLPQNQYSGGINNWQLAYNTTTFPQQTLQQQACSAQTAMVPGINSPQNQYPFGTSHAQSPYNPPAISQQTLLQQAGNSQTTMTPGTNLHPNWHTRVTTSHVQHPNNTIAVSQQMRPQNAGSAHSTMAPGTNLSLNWHARATSYQQPPNNTIADNTQYSMTQRTSSPLDTDRQESFETYWPRLPAAVSPQRYSHQRHSTLSHQNVLLSHQANSIQHDNTPETNSSTPLDTNRQDSFKTSYRASSYSRQQSMTSSQHNMTETNHSISLSQDIKPAVYHSSLLQPERKPTPPINNCSDSEDLQWLKEQVSQDVLNVVLKGHSGRHTPDKCQCSVGIKDIGAKSNMEVDCGGTWEYPNPSAVKRRQKRDAKWIPCLAMIGHMRNVAEHRKVNIESVAPRLKKIFPSIKFDMRVSNCIKAAESAIEEIEMRRSRMLPTLPLFHEGNLILPNDSRYPQAVMWNRANNK